MLTIIMTLNIIVCVPDKIFCVIRKNELYYEPGQGGERRSEKQEIIKIFQPRPQSQSAQCLTRNPAGRRRNTAGGRLLPPPSVLPAGGLIIFI